MTDAIKIDFSRFFDEYKSRGNEIVSARCAIKHLCNSQNELISTLIAARDSGLLNQELLNKVNDSINAAELLLKMFSESSTS